MVYRLIPYASCFPPLLTFWRTKCPTGIRSIQCKRKHTSSTESLFSPELTSLCWEQQACDGAVCSQYVSTDPCWWRLVITKWRYPEVQSSIKPMVQIISKTLKNIEDKMQYSIAFSLRMAKFKAAEADMFWNFIPSMAQDPKTLDLTLPIMQVGNVFH